MLYSALRAASRVALDWYYGGIDVQGRDRVPRRGPLLVVANHPNALVDALLVITSLERRVRLTAKATLFEHRLLAPLLNSVGVVPLRRASDERAARRAGAVSPARNTEAFRRVSDALLAGGVVLVFPEGISHDDPTLAPLKTGAARMALEAHVAGAVTLQLLPVGLVFEEKERPRSRVLVRIGVPVDVDAWCASHGESATSAAALTRKIDAALRDVTLNFATAERAARAVSLARALSAIATPPAGLDRPRPLVAEAEIARRIEAATHALDAASPDLTARAEQLVQRLDALTAQLDERGMQLTDVRVSSSLRHGAWFVVREGVLAAGALPLALLGRITHWLPLHLARRLAMRPLASDPSRDQPAMRTIVLGVAFVAAWYLLQGGLVAHVAGWAAAFLWLVAVFGAACVDFALRDRLDRARRRARTYIALRRDHGFGQRALRELDALLAEALSLEGLLLATARAEGEKGPPDPSAMRPGALPSAGP